MSELHPQTKVLIKEADLTWQLHHRRGHCPHCPPWLSTTMTQKSDEELPHGQRGRPHLEFGEAREPFPLTVDSSLYEYFTVGEVIITMESFMYVSLLGSKDFCLFND